MKRLIIALSTAILSTAALADSKPFEQLDIDRLLPNIPERSTMGVDYPDSSTAPYEQLAVDRALPNLGEERMQVASGGNTRSDVELATEASGGSPWANDHNFIAPAQ